MRVLSGEETNRKDAGPHNHLIAAATVAAGLGAATSAAECAAELDALAAVSKDGTAAPLAEPATPQTRGAEASEQDAAEGPTKDGTQMPLGETGDLATSAGDAQVQREGDETAAAQAQGTAGGEDNGGRQAAINEARAALATDDEEACLAAVERAKAM